MEEIGIQIVRPQAAQTVVAGFLHVLHLEMVGKHLGDQDIPLPVNTLQSPAKHLFGPAVPINLGGIKGIQTMIQIGVNTLDAIVILHLSEIVAAHRPAAHNNRRNTYIAFA